MKKTWIGTAPKECNLHQGPLDSTFIDGKTVHGPWAFMCPDCHEIYGVGLGTGKGQRYELQDGEWVKTAG